MASLASLASVASLACEREKAEKMECDFVKQTRMMRMSNELYLVAKAFGKICLIHFPQIFFVQDM